MQASYLEADETRRELIRDWGIGDRVCRETEVRMGGEERRGAGIYGGSGRPSGEGIPCRDDSVCLRSPSRPRPLSAKKPTRQASGAEISRKMPSPFGPVCFVLGGGCLAGWVGRRSAAPCVARWIGDFSPQNNTVHIVVLKITQRTYRTRYVSKFVSPCPRFHFNRSPRGIRPHCRHVTAAALRTGNKPS